MTHRSECVIIVYAWDSLGVVYTAGHHGSLGMNGESARPLGLISCRMSSGSSMTLRSATDVVFSRKYRPRRCFMLALVHRRPGVFFTGFCVCGEAYTPSGVV